MLFAQILVTAIGIYLALGILFAAYFVTSQISRFDAAAKGTGIGFRALIFFGAVPFWPILAGRVWGLTGDPVENNSHRRSSIEKKDD